MKQFFNRKKQVFLDLLCSISHKNVLWCFWYMQAPPDYLSKIFLQCSQYLIPSWLNMSFLQTALLLLTPVLGLTRISLEWLQISQPTNCNVFSLHHLPIVCNYIGHTLFLRHWEMVKAGFYNLSKHMRLDVPWYVYIFSTF